MINWPIQFLESKYSRWYNNLIQKAILRGKIQGYKETHHIIPRSFGGSGNKSNLVQLTAREHYIAHALLWKMKFPGVYGSKMAFAFNTFINKMTTKERGIHHTYKISSRIYETFRKQYSQILKEKYAREGGTFTGRTHSIETRKIIGEKSKLKNFKSGPEHPNWGKKITWSEKSKKNHQEMIKKTWNDFEKRSKILKNREISNQRPETISKRKAASDSRKGVKRDPAIIEKTAVKKRGKKWKELYSPESIERMHEARKNRVLSDEAKEKMRLGRLKGIRMPKSDEWKRQLSERMTGIKRPTKMCEYCGKIAVLSNHNRWHGDNCRQKSI